MSDVEHTDIDPLLKRLHLANARRVWRELARRAEQERWSYEQCWRARESAEIWTGG